MKKGQSEVVTFVLLFLIGLVLFMGAVAWSTGLFQQNVDIGKVTTAENFMYELDSSIQSVIRHGGNQAINYRIDGTIEIRDVGYEDYIEVKMPVTIDLPRYWINITRADSAGSIREILEGTDLRIQLSYPEKDDYIIDLYTEGAKVAQPDQIFVEKTGTAEDQGKTIISIKVTFQ